MKNFELQCIQVILTEMASLTIAKLRTSTRTDITSVNK